MKASGSYASLVRGVSQQVPQERGAGQCSEQINMLPDPVEGLCRRQGSRFVAEKNLSISPSLFANLTADTDNWRTIEYSNGGNDYVVLMRTAARASGSTLPPLLVYNRTTQAFMSYVRNVTDATLDLFESGGCSAVTPVGKYLFMAGHSIVPAATSVDLWADATNQGEAAFWVRGGAYARTYKVTATKTDNTVYSFEYTTPKSAYQGTLDTTTVALYAADPAGGTATDTEAAYIAASNSYTHTLGWAAWAPATLTAKKGGTAMTNTYPAAPTTNLQFSWATGAPTVLFHSSNSGAVDVTISYTHTKTISNPLYAKTVNDLVNTYNNAVTAWIGTSAEATQPQNIAEQLRLAAVAAGLTGGTRDNSHVYFTNVKAITVNDGGDGSLLRAVANEVTSVDQVTDRHFVGKVVKVRAKTSAESFYLKATAKDSQVTSGFTEVVWVEGCGKQHTINTALVYATVSGSNVYVASSASLLNAIIAGTHPTYVASSVGDDDTSPLPHFIGKKITFLGMFQDRLLIGAGAVVRASRTSDYLNLFRQSVLANPADDPLEMIPQGAEQDELRYGVMYDQNMVIFGRERQYVIAGRTVLSPSNANMATMSSHKAAADLPPLAAGSLIFYGKLGETSASVHQIQPGLNPESPDSYLASSQLNSYLGGRLIELCINAKPACLFARATGKRNSLYVFHYLDTTEGRKQDAWHRWDMNSALGVVIGMSQSPEGLLVYSLRTAQGATWVVADLFPLTAGLATYPYLDSIRPWATVAANTGSLRANVASTAQVAFDTTSEWRFIGDEIANAATLQSTYPSATGLRAGFSYEASYTPTNPFMLDRNNKAITTGRLVITNLLATIAQSSGFATVVETRAGTDSKEFNGRVVGDPNNVVGREVVSDMQKSIPIGRETREYDLTIKARKWLPLTLTALEWVGQFFNRTQRF